MSTRTARSEASKAELLHKIEVSARRHADLEAEVAAEKERRDRLIAQAEGLGYGYREIAAAARAGDGHATTSMVRNAVIDVASGRYDQKGEALSAQG